MRDSRHHMQLLMWSHTVISALQSHMTSAVVGGVDISCKCALIKFMQALLMRHTTKHRCGQSCTLDVKILADVKCEMQNYQSLGKIANGPAETTASKNRDRKGRHWWTFPRLRVMSSVLTKLQQGKIQTDTLLPFWSTRLSLVNQHLHQSESCTHKWLFHYRGCKHFVFPPRTNACAFPNSHTAEIVIVLYQCLLCRLRRDFKSVKQHNFIAALTGSKCLGELTVDGVSVQPSTSKISFPNSLAEISFRSPWKCGYRSIAMLSSFSCCPTLETLASMKNHFPTLY